MEDPTSKQQRLYYNSSSCDLLATILVYYGHVKKIAKVSNGGGGLRGRILCPRIIISAPELASYPC